jgi:hypothetical protein
MTISELLSQYLASPLEAKKIRKAHLEIRDSFVFLRLVLISIEKSKDMFLSRTSALSRLGGRHAVCSFVGSKAQ